MIPLYQCAICHSKILENRLQKHHLKVHANINDDIYTKITSIASDMPPNGVINATEKSPEPNHHEWGIEQSKEEQLIHVSCHVCQNRMPAENLDSHMKRKHSNTTDQVDAIGIKMNDISLDVVEQSALTDSFNTKFIREQWNKQANQGVQEASKSINPFRMAVGNSIHSRLDVPNNEPVFYTIRVSEDQMQQLLNENRIYPKNGFFHLK